MKWLALFTLGFWRALFDVRLGLGGGSGGGGTTQFNWNDQLAPYWESELARASAASNAPQGALPQQQVAGLTQDQQNAAQNLRLFTSDPTYGVKDPNQSLNSAQNFENATLSGNYLTGQGADPWAQSMISADPNSYIGNSPQFEQVLQNGMGDITRAYQQGTAADTTRMFNQAGAFGGSAYGNAVANNENALGRQLGTYAAGMQNDQYNRSAQLTDAGLNRQLQADTTNKSLGQQSYEDELNRMMGTLAPAQNEQQLALQRAQALMGVGDINQQQTQQQFAAQYQNAFNQFYYPQNQASWLAGILSGAQGGLPPNQMTSQAGYNPGAASSILGTALAGYGLFGSH